MRYLIGRQKQWVVVVQTVHLWSVQGVRRDGKKENASSKLLFIKNP